MHYNGYDRLLAVKLNITCRGVQKELHETRTRLCPKESCCDNYAGKRTRFFLRSHFALSVYRMIEKSRYQVMSNVKMCIAVLLKQSIN